MNEHTETPTPTCPGCDHALTIEEMQLSHGASEEDLFGLAPDEGRAVIKCPVCDIEYHCKGGYRPHYCTSFNEDDL